MNNRVAIVTSTIVLGVISSNSFGLTLSEFWHEALEHDPRISLYRERLQAAAQSNPLALSHLLPHLSFEAGEQWNNHNITKPVNKYDADSVILSRSRNNNISSWSVAIKQSIFNWQYIKNYQASQYQVEAAAALYQKSMQELEREAIDAYVSWQLAYANLNGLERTKRAVMKQTFAALERFKYGTAGILGAEEAKVALGQTNSAIEGAKASYISAAQKLFQFTGVRPPSSAPALPVDLDIDVSKYKHWVAQALHYNPGLSAAEYQIDSLNSRVSAARGSFYPIVNLILAHQWRNESGTLSFSYPSMPGTPAASGSGIPDPHSYIGNSIMLELNFPIFSGGSQQASLAQAQYSRQAGVSELLATKRKILTDLKISLAGVIHGKKQADILRRSLSVAKQATRKAAEGVQVGLISESNALTDLKNELSVRNGLNTVNASTIKNYASLTYTAGILSPEVINRLSRKLSIKTIYRSR